MKSKYPRLTDKQVKDHIRSLDIPNREKHRMYKRYLETKSKPTGMTP